MNGGGFDVGGWSIGLSERVAAVVLQREEAVLRVGGVGGESSGRTLARAMVEWPNDIGFDER